MLILLVFFLAILALPPEYFLRLALPDFLERVPAFFQHTLLASASDSLRHFANRPLSLCLEKKYFDLRQERFPLPQLRALLAPGKAIILCLFFAWLVVTSTEKRHQDADNESGKHDECDKRDDAFLSFLRHK